MWGVGAVALCTLLAASADASAKRLSQDMASVQLFVLSGVMALALTLATRPVATWRATFHTAMPGAMAVRSIATVISVSCYFYAFKYLNLAEVFPYVAMSPVFAALMSAPILKERVRGAVWVAIVVGVAGIMLLRPEGASWFAAGHGFAFFASLSGTVSIVMARLIGQREKGSLAMVLWPSIAIVASMMPFAPFVWANVAVSDYLLIAAYGGFSFYSRLLMVHALRMLPAHTTSALLNIHFLWMVVIGFLAFDEVPSALLVTGAVIVILANVYLVYDQCRPRLQMAVQA